MCSALPFNHVTHISRYQKLDVRLRKLAALPADSVFRDEKYRSAFAVQQMSDDEDTFKEDGTLLRSVYTSRAPTWRAAIVGALWLSKGIMLINSGQPIVRGCGQGVRSNAISPVCKTRAWRAKGTAPTKD